jgi:hypothetical protein
MTRASSQSSESQGTHGWVAGMGVAVRIQFTGEWSPGFVLDGRDPDGRYRIQRLSDGSILPALFRAEDLRRV